MLTSKMRGAVSYQKSAAAASWRKWDGQDFTIRENLISFASARDFLPLPTFQVQNFSEAN